MMVIPRKTRRLMILLLMIMSPGIPEYMTGSSRLGTLISDTPSFFMGLALNIALYTAGVLLIREFSIRYNKGWASILILGLAYGIMEEGISVHTFFAPSGNPVGLLGIYGRSMGVDWIWALGISFFHAIFSIGLPILLLSVAYPNNSREPLLARKGIAVVLFVYILDVIILNIAVNTAKPASAPSPGDYVFFLLLSGILLLVARFLPGNLLKGAGKEEQGTKKFFLLGTLPFTLYAVNAFLPFTSDGNPRISPFLEALLFVTANVLIMLSIAHFMPGKNNRRHKYALAVGLITPLFVWAELVQIIGIAPLITVVSVIGIIFLLKLRKLVKTGQNLSAPVAEPALY